MASASLLRLTGAAAAARPRYGAVPVRRLPKPLSAYAIGIGLAAFDVIVLLASGGLASLAGGWLGIDGTAEQLLLATSVATAVTSLMLRRRQAYANGRLHDLPHRGGALARALPLGAAAGLLSLALTPVGWAGATMWAMIWLVCAGVVTGVSLMVSAIWAASEVNRVRLARRVALVGVTDAGHEFISRLAEDPAQNNVFVGLYADDPSELTETWPPNVAGGLEDLIERSGEETIDAVVLAFPLSDLDRVSRAQAALCGVAVDIYVAGGILDLAFPEGHEVRLGSNAVIKIVGRPLTESQMLQKRLFDWVLSLGILIVLLPLLAIVAAAIRLDSRGPVLFRQPRTGLSGRSFVMFKFRSMFHDMADLKADKQTTKDDPRITRVGRWLRKTSIDELPQLINVLLGQMSLVGPRPHAPNTKAGGRLFQDAVRDYPRRHRMKPGITGWAQVNGWRGETRTCKQLEQRVAHDLHYIENWSLRLDLKIILLTALRELNSKVAF